MQGLADFIDSLRGDWNEEFTLTVLWYVDLIWFFLFLLQDQFVRTNLYGISQSMEQKDQVQELLFVVARANASRGNRTSSRRFRIRTFARGPANNVAHALLIFAFPDCDGIDPSNLIVHELEADFSLIVL
ncbi:hypothetical protein Salat_2763200 [Sesamum alatum]|uniref:Uncharacterized protein n=1 Tax=Sesamum alatum TaxID=300844 RepID=A0AAE1XLD7_9LAMI|nr:hypothetical protein Salat_2763200 [Sesamum alatum]